MRKALRFISEKAFTPMRFSVSAVATASGTTKSDSDKSFSNAMLFTLET